MNKKLYLNFRHYGLKGEEDAFFEGGLRTTQNGAVTELALQVSVSGLPYDFQRVLQSEYAAFVELEIGAADGVLSRVQYSPFWSRPSFETDFSKIPDQIQNMLVKQKDRYLAVLPLVSGNLYSYISPSEQSDILRIKTTGYYEGMRELNGVIALLCEAADPYQAVQMVYAYASEKGYISTVLRKDKKLQDMYRGLGWCTWNACYHEVTEQKILDKLEELKEKKVPLTWIMIDDGWFGISEKNEFQITTFFEDKQKFPNGLAGCIRKLKEEYGVQKVGVWHSFTGYWYGIAKESPIYHEEKSRLLETNSGDLIPDPEQAYDFFCDWYQYLKAQGVDFVKIDTQGNGLEFMKGKKDCVQLAAILQEAVDRAAADYFGGNVINCMGMGNWNAHNRPYSVLSRNSDDFFPDKPESFREHLEQNVYNAVFHGNLFYCDFDMWWTEHADAKKSSILRLISGGPVYVSDAVGHTDAAILHTLMDEKGRVMMCDDIPLPTQDCLFGHTGLIKVKNCCGGRNVLAVFNLTDQEYICEDGVVVAAGDAELIWES